MIDLLKDHFGSVLSIGVNLIIAYVLWSVRKAFPSRDEYNAFKSDCDARMSALEKDIKTIPTTKDFHELAITNARLEEKIQSLNESIKGMGRTIGLIDDYLRGRG